MEHGFRFSEELQFFPGGLMDSGMPTDQNCLPLIGKSEGQKYFKSDFDDPKASQRTWEDRSGMIDCHCEAS